MPVYDFDCSECGTKFEAHVASKADKTKIRCPNGHTHIRRLFNAPAVIFKGNGFYVNDSRGKGNGSMAQ